MTNIEVALMDSIKTIIEVTCQRAGIPSDTYAKMFKAQAAAAIKAGNGEGAAVFAMLGDFCARQEAGHTLLEAPPAGSA